MRAHRTWPKRQTTASRNYLYLLISGTLFLGEIIMTKNVFLRN